jgi:hypothetical protein
VRFRLTAGLNGQQDLPELGAAAQEVLRIGAVSPVKGPVPERPDLLAVQRGQHVADEAGDDRAQLLGTAGAEGDAGHLDALARELVEVQLTAWSAPYNNYFSSREQAIVAAVTAEREARVAAAVSARPVTVRLADAVTEAIVEHYTDPGSRDPRALLLLTASPALRDAYLGTAAGIEDPLTAAIAGRIGDTGQHTARVLSASVTAAVRVALQQWVRPADFGTASELVIPSGSLPDLLRAALAPLAPALDAAESRPAQRPR